MDKKIAPAPPLTLGQLHDARVRKALDDELRARGLTIDTPRELWPEDTILRASARIRREAPRPS